MDHALERDAMRRAQHWLREARAVVALTGAGISTESGIPDFRGPQGVWTRDPQAEKLSDIRYYLADAQIRRKAWQTRLHSPVWSAQPNAGHAALAALERRGKLLALITQNTDGLHLLAGHAPDNVIEIHGTMRDVRCMQCDYRVPMELVMVRLRAGEEDPHCPECRGILKSATISFGQSLEPRDLARADFVARSCDLLLAVGSTLSVFPAASVVPVARSVGARIVIVNAAPTAMDDVADVVLRGNIGEVLPALVAGTN
jgi:NAD-dependent deacetylase